MVTSIADKDPWAGLARTHGPKSVMSLTISMAQLNAETKRQSDVIFPMIRDHLNGKERTAVDFGCGAGRFTPHLHNLMPPGERLTVGFDPCQELLTEAPVLPGISWESMRPDLFFFRNGWAFDIAFTAMVLCLPHVDASDLAEGLSRIMARDGLLVIVDHMSDAQPQGKWVRFRPEKFYIDLFARWGVTLKKIGDDHQLDNPITILAGRKK